MNLNKHFLIGLVLAVLGASLVPLAHAQTTSTETPQTKVPTVKTPTEREHMPVIRVPEIVGEGELFFASIQVGEGPHEMKENHRIEWIEGFLDGKMLFHLTLSPLFPEPRLNIPMRIQHASTLKIEAHCSVHGTWGTEFLIRTQAPEPPTG